MGSLYLSSRYWPVTPSLEPYRGNGTQAALFTAPADLTPENLTLLEKILASVRWELSGITLWKVNAPLSWGRLQVLSYPYFWVFDPALLSVPVGIYEVQSGQRIMRFQPGLRGLVWCLPALSEMQRHVSAKQEAWRWLKLLGSRS